MGKIITEVVLAAIAFCGIFSVAWWACKVWFFKAVPKHVKTAEEIFKAGDKYDDKIHKL